jgi:hypothetical protein
MLLREWFKAQRRAQQENHVHGYQYAAGCLLAGAKVETIEALCCCDEEFDEGMLHAIRDWERLTQRRRAAAFSLNRDPPLLVQALRGLDGERVPVRIEQRPRALLSDEQRVVRAMVEP